MNQLDIDKNIAVTESRNLDDDSTDTSAQKDGDTTTLHELLEDQGVSILEEKKGVERIEPQDEISRELMDQGGIEIIHADDTENPLY